MFRWNPFIYVIRNGNIRIYLPMHRHLQQETHRMCLLKYIHIVSFF